MMMAYYSLNLPGSNSPPASASQVVGTTGVHHHTWGIYFVEMGSHCIAQAGLKLVASIYPPSLASQSAKIIGVRHHAWLEYPALKEASSRHIPSPFTCTLWLTNSIGGS
uniref:Uncharacterized protein n=1 Tax=Macaca fascicularis TaxID=9541 RepID=A0A7N9CB82_MACFA